jgi:hypothetical protein
MAVRIAVHFAGRGLKDRCLQSLRESEHVYRAKHVSLDRVDRIELVMNGRGGALKVVDRVDVDEERLGDVVPHQLEAGVAEQMCDVFFASGVEVIDADHFMAVREKPLA